MGVVIIRCGFDVKELRMGISDYVPIFEGKIAASTFIITVISFTASQLSFPLYVVVGIELAICVLSFLIPRAKLLHTSTVTIAIISHLLGIVFGTGALISLMDSSICYMGIYMMVLSFFHWSEYVATSIYNPTSLSLSSFLLDHSREYGIAAVASWIEYGLEYYFCPWIKSYWVICWLGIILTVCGEGLRKVAMLTASTNFNHHVQIYKHYDHELVTSGVYGFVRHPSYVGWFYWSIGTQLLLCNPFCTVAYALASWSFFNDRIQHEEQFLVHFFGEKYLNYQKEVGTGLPFIHGFETNRKT
jgi:protein-S-isoprenylcysteine O-methyltransferase